MTGLQSDELSFWRVSDDMHYPSRWYLDEIEGVGIEKGYNWQFLTGDGLEERLYKLSLTRDGAEMDFTMTDAFAVPIVSDRVKCAIDFIEGVRFFSLILDREAQPRYDYYAMVTYEMVDCFDKQASVYQTYRLDDPVRPDRAGEYHSALRLVVDPKKAAGHDIFRIKRYPTALIVSNRVKTILDKLDLSGIRYELCA